MAGVCHRTAPLDARQERALSADRARAALGAVRSDGVAREALVLSTCNRVELYAAGDDPAALERRLRAVLGAGDLTTVRRGADAARHIFRVAAGLESRIPGDDGIRGQLRDAAADRAVADAACEWMAWWSAAGSGPAIAAMRAEEEGRLRRAVEALPPGEREGAWREGRRVLGAVLHRRTPEMRGRLSPA